jgi:hypothetical protein
MKSRLAVFLVFLIAGFVAEAVLVSPLYAGGDIRQMSVSKLSKDQVDRLWHTVGAKHVISPEIRTAQVTSPSGEKESEILTAPGKKRKEGFFKNFELHGEERFGVYYNRVRGNKDNAQLDEGPQFLQELDLTLQHHGARGREFEMVFNSRLTDDKYVDTEHASIVDFHITQSGESYLFTVGDYLGTLSDFTFNQALRGVYAEKAFSSLRGLKIVALAGVMNDRWEAFWKNLESESYARYYEGARVSFNPLRPLTLGFNFINGSDDPGSVPNSTSPALENRVGSMDFSLAMLDNSLTFGGEAAWSWFESHDTSGDVDYGITTREGTLTDAAYKLSGSYQKDKYALNGGYSRVEPNFRSIGGMSSPDTEEYYATADYTPIPQIGLMVGYRASRDNLDGQLETTTRNKMPEFSITFQEIPHLDDLTVTFKVNRATTDTTDDSIDETTDTGDVEIEYAIYGFHISANGEIRNKMDDVDRLNNTKTHGFGVHLDRAFEKGIFRISPYVGFDWERQKGKVQQAQTPIYVDGVEQLEVTGGDATPAVFETLRFTRTYSAGCQMTIGKDWDVDFKYQYVDEDINTAGGGDSSTTSSIDASLTYRIFGHENDILSLYYRQGDHNFNTGGDDYREDVFGAQLTKRF